MVAVKRTVAVRDAQARGAEGGLLTLTLTLAPGYSALASARGGLSATVEVLFARPVTRRCSDRCP